MTEKSHSIKLTAQELKDIISPEQAVKRYRRNKFIWLTLALLFFAAAGSEGRLDYAALAEGTIGTLFGINSVRSLASQREFQDLSKIR